MGSRYFREIRHLNSRFDIYFVGPGDPERNSGRKVRYRMQSCNVWTSLLSGLILAALSVTTVSAQGDSEVQQGFAIAPVPLNLQRLNRAMVGRGSYLVN